jgi:hypothetical protein
MRRAKRRRRAKGLLSIIEVAVMFELPFRFVKRAADEGTLPLLQAGSRRYIRREDAERVFGCKQAKQKP